MRKLILMLAVILVTASISLQEQALAQTPQKMSYQAVVRNSSNVLVTDHAVGMMISILQGSALSSTVVYAETQTPTTNANGLINIAIGTGSVTSGSFSAIDWSAGPYFIKTEIDPEGGTTYSIASISELLSVPYAMYAGNAANGFSGDYNNTVRGS